MKLRRATAMFVAAALLPLIGTTSAHADPKAESPPPLEAMQAKGRKLVGDALAGKPSMPMDCDTLLKNEAKLKREGKKTASCIQRVSPEEAKAKGAPPPSKLIDDAEAQGAQATPPPQEPSDPNDPVTANGLDPWHNMWPLWRPDSCERADAQPPPPEVPGAARSWFHDRMDGCQVYYFNHLVRRLSDGVFIGLAAYQVVYWQLLNRNSRFFDMHYTAHIYFTFGVANPGMWTYMFADTAGGARKHLPAQPADAWKFVTPHQTFYGRQPFASIDNPVDLSWQGLGIVTWFPGGTDAWGIAVVQQPVRCENLVPGRPAGCSYFEVPGLITYSTRTLDGKVNEAAVHYREAQNSLSGKPGHIAGFPLTRATPDEVAANRSVSLA
ncbi:MAG: hypothetical protein LC799_22005 [Actinobacteria bacterium]|nr:hypothetical protein [Actinomycetota bacterium]